jgi:alpha-glucoside transport system permease protein
MSRSGRAVRRGGAGRVGRRGGAGWPVWIAVTAICVLWLIPTAGTVITSFRTSQAANSSGWWRALITPFDTDQYTLLNYRFAWTGGMASSYLNSIAVTLPAVALPVLLAAFAAYALTFMLMPGAGVWYGLIVSLLIVPTLVVLPPLLRIESDVGIVGTYAAAYLVHAGFGLPLAVLILRAYMARLPRSLVDSAAVDGASHWQTFWRLVMPLSLPALASVAVFQFLTVWNDLLVALVFIGEGDHAPVTITLAGAVGGVGGQAPQFASGAALIAVSAPVVVFLALQRYFVQGLTTGATGG